MVGRVGPRRDGVALDHFGAIVVGGRGDPD